MVVLLIKILTTALLFNLLYELCHSFLYKTCLEAKLEKYVYLILKAAVFDGLIIVAGHVITGGNRAIFIALCLLFAYVWEVYSLKKKKWECSKNMPLVLGVGVTPLIQLAVTGLASLYFVSYLW